MVLKVIVKLIFAILLLCTINLGMLAHVRDRAFPIEVSALKGDLFEMRAWDFSQEWMVAVDSRTNVIVYGDSLVSESIAGRRAWYLAKDDSLSYLGEEDRLMSVSCDSAAFLCKLPVCHGYDGHTRFSAKGKGGGRKFEIAESGMIDFQVSANPGKLILSQGDTIANVTLARERRNFTASFPEDSLANDVYMTVETYRWFDKTGLANHLPLALQQSVYYRTNSDYTIIKDSEAASARAFIADRSAVEKVDGQDEASDEDVMPDFDAIREDLKNVRAGCDGRIVTVGYDMQQCALVVTVDIMDASGRLYFHEQSNDGDSKGEITVDCSALRSGEYLVAVGVKDLPVEPEKRLVIIK